MRGYATLAAPLLTLVFFIGCSSTPRGPAQPDSVPEVTKPTVMRTGNLPAAGGVCTVQFSADGTRLLATDYRSGARLWETGTWREIGSFQYEGVGSVAGALSPDGSKVATGGVIFSTHNVPRVWDATTGEPLFRVEGETATAEQLAYSPDGKYLAAAHGPEFTVRIWKAGSGDLVRSYSTGEAWAHGLAFSPNSQFVAIAAGDDVLMWEISKEYGSYLVSGRNQGSSPTCLAWGRTDNDSGVLAVGHENGMVSLNDARSGTLLRTFKGHKGYVHSVAYLGDGVIVSGGKDGTVRLWNDDTGECIRIYQYHSGEVQSVALSPDGRYFASGGSDGMTCIVKVEREMLRGKALLYSILEEPLPPLMPDQPELKTASEYYDRCKDGVGGHMDLEKQRRGMADFRRALALDPGNADYWYAFARFHCPMTQKDDPVIDYVKAGRIAEGAAELDPGNLERWFRASQYYTHFKLEKAEYMAALRCLDRATETAPDSAKPYYWRGIMRYNAPEGAFQDAAGTPKPRRLTLQESLDDLETAMGLPREFTTAEEANLYGWAGTHAEDLEMWEKSVSYRAKVAEIDPGYKSTFRLGEVYCNWAHAERYKFTSGSDGTRHQLPQKERLEKAVELHERAIAEATAEGKTESPRDYLALALGSLHRYGDALATYEADKPGDLDSKLAWAKCHYQAGGLKSAIALTEGTASRSNVGLELVLLSAVCKGELSEILGQFPAEAEKLAFDALADLKKVKDAETGGAQFKSRWTAALFYAAYCHQGPAGLLLDNFSELEKACADDTGKSLLLSSVFSSVLAVEAFFDKQKEDLEAVIESHSKLLEQYNFGWTMDCQWEAAFAWRVKSQMLNQLLGLDSNAASFQDIVACLDKALEYRPAYPQALIERAYFSSLLDQDERSEADCTAAIALQPRCKFAYQIRMDNRLRLGKWKEVAEDARKLILFDPADIYYRIMLAGACIHLGELDAAQGELDRVISAAPENAEALATRADLHTRRNDHGKALEDLDRAIAAAPNHAFYYYQRCRTYGALGRHDKALDDANAAAKLAPHVPSYLRQRALVHADLKDWASAIVDVTTVIEATDEPRDFSFRSMCRFSLARKTRDRKTMEDALADCEQAIGGGHKGVIAHRALMHYALGKRPPEGSPKVFEQELEDGQLDEALDRANNGIKENPKDAREYCIRARVFLAQKKWQEALDDLNIAVSLDDKLAEPYIWRAAALVGLGKSARAREDLEIALEKARTQEFDDLTIREYALAQVYALRSAAHGDETDKDDKSREDRKLAIFNLRSAVGDAFFPWGLAKVDPALASIMSEKEVQELFKGH